jgi:hypothetical protein
MGQAMGQVIGHGSKLELDTSNPANGSSGDTWTTIAGTTSVDLGSNKVDTHDNTDMGTTGTKRTFIPGLENEGDISVKLNAIPGDASQALLYSAKGVLSYFKIIYPGAVRTIAFQGIITSVDESIPDDKLPTLTAKIQVSGPKTYS